MSNRLGSEDERLYLPKHLIAKTIGISVQAFSNWGLTAEKRRGREALYFLPDVFTEFARRRAPHVDGEALDPNQERARKDKEAADKLAMENAVRRGELADLNQVAKVRALELANFRARLRAAPSKLAPRVNPENPNLAADLIAAEHDAILAELADADWTESFGGGEGVSGVALDPPAAAAADGEPVGGREPDAVGRKQRRTRKVEH